MCKFRYKAYTVRGLTHCSQGCILDLLHSKNPSNFGAGKTVNLGAVIDAGLGTARAEDAQGTPTQSHVSLSILVYGGQDPGLTELVSANRRRQRYRTEHYGEPGHDPYPEIRARDATNRCLLAYFLGNHKHSTYASVKLLTYI